MLRWQRVAPDDDETLQEKPKKRAPAARQPPEAVTLRRIEPIKVQRVDPLASTMVARELEADAEAGAETTNPDAGHMPELRASAPELGPSAPEFEAALAPPTFESPARSSSPGGASTQLSIVPRATHRSLQSLACGMVVGDYEIDRKIGEGAMSEVYSAVHRAIGRRVAIKVISTRLFDDPDAEARFLSEARAVAAIHHPGIVDVFGFGTLDDGRMYLIMEWLHGRSLAARLSEGPLSLTDASEIVLQITTALRAAHEQDIVHRDLKPDNVFLQEFTDEKPLIKILDFGLAKRTRDEAISRTRTGQLLGTPLYISPEQARGKAVDYRTDIYALGCIAYQLFTGRPPFLADNAADLVAAHLTERPPMARAVRAELPASLDRLLQLMIDKDPAQRPTLAQVRRTMQAILGIGTGAMAAVLPPDDIADDLLETLPRGDDNESVETVELPSREQFQAALAARHAGAPAPRHTATTRIVTAPSSRALIIGLWLLLLVSVALLVTFIVH